MNGSRSSVVLIHRRAAAAAGTRTHDEHALIAGRLPGTRSRASSPRRRHHGMAGWAVPTLRSLFIAGRLPPPRENGWRIENRFGDPARVGGIPLFARRLAQSGLVGAGMVLLLTTMTALAHAGGGAGIVYVGGTTHRGAITLRDEAVRVDDQPIARSAVDAIVIHRDGRSHTTPHLVTLDDGERWAGTVIDYDQQRLRLTGPLLDDRTLDADRLDRITFVTGRADAAPIPPGTLIRTEGEPIPGELMWIDPREVGLDSPLGVVTLPRERVVAYRFPATADGATGADDATDAPDGPNDTADNHGDRPDRLTLTDGSVLHGRLVLGDNAVGLAHPRLGRMVLPQSVVHRIRFGDRPVHWLTADDLSAEGVDVFGHPLDPAMRQIEAAGMTAFRIEVGATVSVRRPGHAASRARTFLAAARVNAPRGVELRLTARLGDERIAGQVLTADDRVHDLRITPPAEVPRDAPLTLTVRPGPSFAMPAGLILQDPRWYGPPPASPSEGSD